MKTKTLSLILAIAMLLCGCQTAPAQSVPAAPAQVESEAPVVEKVAAPEKEAVYEQPKESEASNDAQSSVETMPYDHIVGKSRTVREDVGIKVYSVDGKMVAIKEKEKPGYVLGKHRNNNWNVKVIDENKMLCFDGKEILFFDTNTFEKLDQTIDFDAVLYERYDTFEVALDKEREQYVIACVAKTGEKEVDEYGNIRGINCVEFYRYNFDGSFIDKYTTDRQNSYEMGITDIHYKDDKVVVVAGLYGFDWRRQDCITYDFADESYKEYRDVYYIDNRYNRDTSAVYCTDIVKNSDIGKKIVTMHSILLKKGQRYDAEIVIEADASINDMLLKIIKVDEGYDDPNKPNKAFGYWVTYDLDYSSGVGSAVLGPVIEKIKAHSEYTVASSADGRYSAYQISDEADYEQDRYAVVCVDNFNGKAYFLTDTEYIDEYHYYFFDCEITNEYNLLYDKDGKIWSVPVTGGECFEIIDYNQATESMADQYGLRELRVTGYDYDPSTEKIAVTMVDMDYGYWQVEVNGRYDYSDKEQREKLKYELLKPHCPNYLLAVYETDGTFVKNVVTDSAAYDTGKHGGEYGYITVENGKTHEGFDYINGDTRYIMDGSTVYWQPLEKTDENVIKWRSFETGKVGEIKVPTEWDELIYVLDGCMIFRNVQNGSCYKCDMTGELIDSFTCEKVAGANGIKWYPLSDFSGVLCTYRSYYEDFLCFINKTGEIFPIGEEAVYRVVPRAVKDGKIMINRWDYDGRYHRSRTKNLVLVDFNKQTVSSVIYEIANNSDGVLQAKFYELRTMDEEEIIIAERLTNSADDNCALMKNDEENWFAAYWFGSGKFLRMSKEIYSSINSDRYFINDDILCYLAVDENGVHYRTLDLVTGEQKSILTNLPADYDDLRVVTVTDSGKVIIALQQDSQWKIFARDVKI